MFCHVTSVASFTWRATWERSDFTWRATWVRSDFTWRATWERSDFTWCPWEESNRRPSGPQPDALSTELQGQNSDFKALGSYPP